MAKKSGVCLLCDVEDKGRLFTFYSGVKKKGSHTRLQTVTVTVMERWRELRIYEAFVCKACQLRLWTSHTKWPPLLCFVAAGLVFPFAVLSVALLPLVAGLSLGGVFCLVVLGLGGAGAWYLLRHLAKKPEREPLEKLVVAEAARRMPTPGHTFITVGQYQDLIDAGIVDT